MKILLLGDYSNYHACLADALRRGGHSVTLASDGSGWMNTQCTLRLRRPLPGPAGGALLYLDALMSRKRFSGYDIVSLISPCFLNLKPRRIKVIFDRLLRDNGRVFLCAAGSDKAFMDMVSAPDCPLRYCEFFTSPGRIYEPNRALYENEMLWCDGEVAEFCEYVYDRVRGVTTALYEYDLAMRRRFDTSKVRYVGIPVDLNAVERVGMPCEGNTRVNMFLGRHAHRKAFKGTDRIELAARRVAESMPDKCSLEIVENVPYSEYLQKLRRADIVLDQLYSYTPATNALLGMAMGKAVLSGGEPEYYDFIGEKESFPIINAVPDDDILFETLRAAVADRAALIEKGAAGREFVNRHNSADIVAARCIDFWQS